MTPSLTPAHLAAIAAMLGNVRWHKFPLSDDEYEALAALRDWCREAMGALRPMADTAESFCTTPDDYEFDGSLLTFLDCRRARALLANFPEVKSDE